MFHKHSCNFRTSMRAYIKPCSKKTDDQQALPYSIYSDMQALHILGTLNVSTNNKSNKLVTVFSWWAQQFLGKTWKVALLYFVARYISIRLLSSVFLEQGYNIGSHRCYKITRMFVEHKK